MGNNQQKEECLFDVYRLMTLRLDLNLSLYAVAVCHCLRLGMFFQPTAIMGSAEWEGNTVQTCRNEASNASTSAIRQIYIYISCNSCSVCVFKRSIMAVKFWLTYTGRIQSLKGVQVLSSYVWQCDKKDAAPLILTPAADLFQVLKEIFRFTSSKPSTP